MPGSLIVPRCMRADSHAAEDPEGGQRSGGVDPRKLAGRLPSFPLLGREQANWRDQRHEGKPGARSFRGRVGGPNP